MRLKPNSLSEYKRYHHKVWPELLTEIERQGVAQITILKTTQRCLCIRGLQILRCGIVYGRQRFMINGEQQCRSSSISQPMECLILEKFGKSSTYTLMRVNELSRFK